MKSDFIYFGLFLNQDIKNKLMNILKSTEYYKILEKADNIYLDHCTLLHCSQNYPKLKEYLQSKLKCEFSATITSIGISDKAIAFGVKFSLLRDGRSMCANNHPHITIATFNGGKPVDSNNIKEWIEFPMILIDGTILKVSE